MTKHRSPPSKPDTHLVGCRSRIIVAPYFNLAVVTLLYEVKSIHPDRRYGENGGIALRSINELNFGIKRRKQ